ncbi:MAG TPA: outer-membrane lipoprotein carrier protein LolA [Pseudolabrys sp.]|jgi:outer membrane lipoprotein-sorting protein|nr:outer-membrane lipoprotein carrier protein LolA [Pseudolabrys sp.]
MAAPYKARTSQKLGFALGFAALLACVSIPAFAQAVPLPLPRPSGLQSQAPAGSTARPVTTPAVPSQALGARAQAPQATQAPPSVQAPNPVSNPFAALLGKAGSAGTLNPEQRAIVERVNAYLSGVQTLTGNFIQVGPDGSRTQGEFYIFKPGRVRFEYDDPSPIELIADGSSVVVRDRRLATQDVYPLSQTPLRFLLAEHVDLTKDTHLISVYADDVFVTVVVEEKNGIVGTSRLMIMFSAKDMQLKQWTVTDPQGYDTTVAVYNLDTSKRPDPSMFKIDYTRYHN